MIGRREAISLGLFVGILLLAVAVRVFIAGGWTLETALLELRIHRTAVGLVVGAALAIGGVFLQCLMRNQLASPDLIGLASGAGLAVMAGEFATLKTGGGSANVLTNAGLAMVGSALSLATVWGLAQKRRMMEPVSLVLVGVIVGLLCSAMTMLLQHQMPGQGESTRRWLLGSLDEGARTWALWAGGGLCAVFGVLGTIWWRRMDAMTMAEDEARSLGVNVRHMRQFLFIGAGVLAAIAVVLAGPIGFVGLACPHVARLCAGPSHRWLILLSAIAGMVLVVSADSVVKMLNLSAGRLPLGVLTTFIGGPVLISMLRRGR